MERRPLFVDDAVLPRAPKQLTFSFPCLSRSLLLLSVYSCFLVHHSVSSAEVWEGVFNLSDFTFDIRFINNPSKNRASIRYVQTVVTDDGSSYGLPSSTEYPFGVTFYQHEHAIIDVDDDCKLLLWDQYGDDKEQADMDAAVLDFLCAVSPESCSGS